MLEGISLIITKISIINNHITDIWKKDFLLSSSTYSQIKLTSVNLGITLKEIAFNYS